MTTHSLALPFHTSLPRRILCALLLGLSGCGGSSAPAPPPNVILITMDTTRADHLGCYGYARPTSPNLDQFAASATRYTRALSTAPWTVPSHASLFTGRFPFEHGSRTYAEPRGNVVMPLEADHITLAEVFAAEGYATGAFIANAGWLNATMKMDQGFDVYHVENTYADQINSRALAWLEQRKAAEEQGFFLFLNYIDVHRPYNTTQPAPFLTSPPPSGGACVKALYKAVMPGHGEVPQDLAQCMIDQYDTGLWNLDAAIGRLVSELKSAGFYDNTVIVITSDHGEFFGEHHLVEHSKDVYEPVVSIPLLFKSPGQSQGTVREEHVTSTDVAGLILAECGPLAAKYEELFHDLPGNHEVVVENYYSRQHDRVHPQWGHRFGRVRTALYDWPYKFIRSSDGNHELYRLDRDAGESDNLLETEAEVATNLATRLADFQNARGVFRGEVKAPELTPDQLEQLKALGYLGD